MSSKDSKPPSKASTDSRRSGRVSHDARGNPVWEWQTSTGVFEKNASTQNLKKLEAPGLSLLDTQAVKNQKDKESDAKDKLETKETAHMPGGGMNPYNSAGRAHPERPRKEVDPKLLHPALAHKQPATRKEPARQSLQSKYHGKPEAAKKPKGLLGKLKSVFGTDE